MVWALTDSADGGVQCLDFVNAFGTMRRSVIAQQVREHVPELWGIAKLLYDTPSDLYLQTGTGIRCIKSQSGVKQGDPFVPLFYSLGMRPLLDWIKEQNVSGRAYLDDVHNTRITQEQAEEILDAIPLLPEGIRAGLVVNRAKSWYKTYRDLHREGRKVLGTFVGGLTHEGAHLMDSRIERFLERTRECGGLGLQHRLLLLRFCFFPTFNHLLRTIHPDIIRPFAVAFDNAVIDTIAQWFGPLGSHSRDVCHLPTRIGGLGLFSQEAISGVAYGTCAAQALSVLKGRHVPVSEALKNHVPQLLPFNLNAIQKPIPRRSPGPTAHRSSNINYQQDRFPMFITYFHQCVRAQNVAAIHTLYQTSWVEVTEMHYKNTPLPSAEFVAPLVDHGDAS
jgi:hypothetical protein